MDYTLIGYSRIACVSPVILAFRAPSYISCCPSRIYETITVEYCYFSVISSTIRMLCGGFGIDILQIKPDATVL